jgi:hypothetical protein
MKKLLPGSPPLKDSHVFPSVSRIRGVLVKGLVDLIAGAAGHQQEREEKSCNYTGEATYPSKTWNTVETLTHPKHIKPPERY